MSSTTAEEHGRTALVTGCAGFIGSHLTERLLRDGWSVRGVDAFTNFYARSCKERNLESALADPSFTFSELDLSSEPVDEQIEGVDVVFHLAAQAGVRGSFGRTFDEYVRHNVIATQRVLDALVARPGPTFVYASSSSVYGNAMQLPTSEANDRHPVSPYGMTKVATEELAGVYSRTCGIPSVGLRYFTAYGPRQRPDMAFSRFITAALSDHQIVVNGDGFQERDFTYVDDVVDATIAAASHREAVPRVYNVGGTHAVSINEVLDLISKIVGRPLDIRHGSAQRGDARRTSADISAARRDLGYTPEYSLEEGLRAQVLSTMDEIDMQRLREETSAPQPVRLIPDVEMVHAPPIL